MMKRGEQTTKSDVGQWLLTGRPVFIDSTGAYNYLEAVPFGSLDLVSPLSWYLAVDVNNFYSYGGRPRRH